MSEDEQTEDLSPLGLLRSRATSLFGMRNGRMVHDMLTEAVDIGRREQRSKDEEASSNFAATDSAVLAELALPMFRLLEALDARPDLNQESAAWMGETRDDIANLLASPSTESAMSDRERHAENDAANGIIADETARADKAEADLAALLVLLAELDAAVMAESDAVERYEESPNQATGARMQDAVVRLVQARNAAANPITAGRSLLEAARGPIVYRTAEGPNSKAWTAAELLEALARHDDHAVVYFRQALAPILEAERERGAQARSALTEAATAAAAAGSQHVCRTESPCPTNDPEHYRCPRCRLGDVLRLG